MEITAAEFKAKCLKLMDEVAQTREPVVITKRGRAVAKLVPVQAEPETLFGYMKGTVLVRGDITAPAQEAWSALAGDEDTLYPRPAKARAKRAPGHVGKKK